MFDSPKICADRVTLAMTTTRTRRDGTALSHSGNLSHGVTINEASALAQSTDFHNVIQVKSNLASSVVSMHVTCVTRACT